MTTSKRIQKATGPRSGAIERPNKTPRAKKQQAERLQAANDRFLATVRRYVDEGNVTEDVYQSIAEAYASTRQNPDDNDMYALARGLKALAKGTIVIVPTKKTPREQRREIIRKAGRKDRKVLDRLRGSRQEVMRGVGARKPLPARRTPNVAPTEREHFQKVVRQIAAQECDCSENHDYNPACPHTLASMALFDGSDE